MALGRWQATIADEEGNIVPNCFIEVRKEISGSPLVSLYSDRDGTLPIGNPFQADNEGFAFFHVVGGAYKIRAYSGSFERILRYVPVGTAAEGDSVSGLTPMGAWDISTTYAIGNVISHTGGAGVASFASNSDGNLGNEPQFDSSGLAISDAFWTVIIDLSDIISGGSSNLTIYDASTGTNTILASEMATGSLHIFKAGVTNTGAATYNGRPLLDSGGGALRAGEIQAGTWYILVDDGTNYYVVASGAVT